LREAERAIFVGYGMPEDDVQVIYLFKRGLANLDPHRITVVERASGADASLDANLVGQRYRAIFGGDIDWQTNGFAEWTRAAAPVGFAPPRRARRGAAAPAAAR